MSANFSIRRMDSESGAFTYTATNTENKTALSPATVDMLIDIITTSGKTLPKEAIFQIRITNAPDSSERIDLYVNGKLNVSVDRALLSEELLPEEAPSSPRGGGGGGSSVGRGGGGGGPMRVEDERHRAKGTNPTLVRAAALATAPCASCQASRAQKGDPCTAVAITFLDHFLSSDSINPTPKDLDTVLTKGEGSYRSVMDQKKEALVGMFGSADLSEDQVVKMLGGG